MNTQPAQEMSDTARHLLTMPPMEQQRAKREQFLRVGAVLMVSGAVIFLVYAFVFLFLAFASSGFELGVETLNGVTRQQLDGLNPAIMGYIRHLHVATAAFIAATAIAAGGLARYGVRHGLWWAWIIAVIVPVVGLALALPMHYMGHFNYNWVSHLGPIYLGTIIYVVGAAVALVGLTRAGAAAPATGHGRYLPDNETKWLDLHARLGSIYLLVVSLTSFFLGAFFLSGLADGAHLGEVVLDGRAAKFLGQALFGVSGSGVAALTSCLDRFANGFERSNGTSFPVEAKDKEKFSARFAYWLWARPFLGALVAPVFIWGLSHFAKDPQEFTSSNRLIAFTAFMAGLLAKSVLELVKNLFKNVFK